MKHVQGILTIWSTSIILSVCFYYTLFSFVIQKPIMNQAEWFRYIWDFISKIEFVASIEHATGLTDELMEKLSLLR